MCALILGRASTTLQGVQVFPGIVDNDFTGEIQILATAINGVAAIPAGTRLAQLLLLPLHSGGTSTAQSLPRGTASLGSSDIYWVQPISQERPSLTLVIEGKEFQGVLVLGPTPPLYPNNIGPRAGPSPHP
jgi:hypothetical protein